MMMLMMMILMMMMMMMMVMIRVMKAEIILKKEFQLKSESEAFTITVERNMKNDACW